MTPTNDQITAVARALSNDNADVCNVNREDNWNIYGDSFRETARVALEAAFNVSAPAVDGARDEAQWEALAERHANRDWNGDAYLESVKALCADYARAALSASTEAAPINGIPATYSHEEGAIARCSYCGRYSLDPKTLSDRQPMCDCGEKHGWSGSFERPGVDAKWSGATPPPAKLSTETVDKGVDRLTDECIERMARTHLTVGDDGEVYGVVKFSLAIRDAFESATSGALRDLMNASNSYTSVVEFSYSKEWQAASSLLAASGDPEGNCHE